MKKILILYGSLTGNTQAVAIALRNALTKVLNEYQFDLINIHELQIAQILKYEFVIFGTSTWDDGINNPDVSNFLISSADINPDFSNITFALFCLGDSLYPYFCSALEILKPALEKQNGKVYEELFTIDGYPTDQSAVDLFAWASSFIKKHNL
jgi:flavodoxin I